ncbi:MAG: type II secretion system ATPase GspE [Leptospirales bacterium]|nr:type II secretion system ATPase GspE [Leptospirales bacterium]
MPKKLLGELLIDSNVITKEQLQESLLAQKTSHLRIGEILVRKNYAKPEQILAALGKLYGIEASAKIDFDRDTFPSGVSSSFLSKNTLVPFKTENGVIHVAAADILNIHPIDDLKTIFPGFEFNIVLSTKDEIQRLIQTYFGSEQSETANDVIEDLEESDFEILSNDFEETRDIMDMANDAPIIRLVNTMIKQAVADKASDIHIEPYEKDIAVRFRIDGILYKMYSPPKKYQNAIISRIKIMANLNIAENRLPQDGRIQLKISGKDIDIRISIFPTYWGERAVLRILNKSDMDFSLTALGFSSDTLAAFTSLIQKTSGIILVTGPTGSGKSTTLYSVLTKLNTEDVNILTVEDPIEYQLKGIGQMQVKPKIDLTFANGLRSILRQDPDIVMIGEIRDLETAEIAVQSALTGHKVFSTLHTNDAASGVTRLVDMGIEPFLIASAVNAFMAQRLVRNICPSCKTSYKPQPKELAELGLKPSDLKGGLLFKGKGCDKCLNMGYAGRSGIYELLPMSPNIRKLILSHADSETIKEQARKEGMKTLLEDGLQKVIDGLTTVEEVLRVS